jgi:hypothetical protein
MKKLLFAAALLASAFTQASDVRLVVQEMNSGGASNGRTFRVYAVMPSVNHTLQVVYGDASNPLRIESTAPFYQNQYTNVHLLQLLHMLLQSSVHMHQSYGFVEIPSTQKKECCLQILHPLQY